MPQACGERPNYKVCSVAFFSRPTRLAPLRGSSCVALPPRAFAAANASARYSAALCAALCAAAPGFSLRSKWFVRPASGGWVWHSVRSVLALLEKCVALGLLVFLLSVCAALPCGANARASHRLLRASFLFVCAAATFAAAQTNSLCFFVLLLLVSPFSRFCFKKCFPFFHFLLKSNASL